MFTILFTMVTNCYAANPQLLETINEISLRKGLTPRITRAIIQVESSYNVYAIGGLGEIGLMQLHPTYFPAASFNYIKNIEMGTDYLVYLKRKMLPKWKDAWFVAYNTGPYAKIKDPKKTSYYRKVMRAIREYN